MRHIGRVLPRLPALVVALALAGLALPRPAEASLIGDPTLTTGEGRFGLGADLDIVFDRDIDVGNGSLDTNRLLAQGSYGFLRNWDGFVKLGLFNGEVDPGSTDIDLGLAVGVGARGSFLERGDIRVGLLAQLIYFASELDTPGSPDIDWIEVDVAPAVSYRGLGQVVPYGGVKLSWVDGDIDGRFDFEQDDIFGIFGGASVAISQQLQLGAELRLLDESAIGFFARYSF